MSSSYIVCMQREGGVDLIEHKQVVNCLHTPNLMKQSIDKTIKKTNSLARENSVYKLYRSLTPYARPHPRKEYKLHILRVYAISTQRVYRFSNNLLPRRYHCKREIWTTFLDVAQVTGYTSCDETYQLPPFQFEWGGESLGVGWGVR